MAFELLKAIGICGDYYFKSLFLVPGDHAWMLRVSRKLEKERYISRSGKGRLRKLRLTQRGIDLLTDLDEPIARQYKLMVDAENPAGDKKHVWRNLRLSETMQMMRQAGIKVACYEKPVLLPLGDGDLPVNKKLEASYQRKARSYSTAAGYPPMFYTSREMKECDIEEKNKTDFTRMIGILVASGEVYGVYNMNTGFHHYKPDSENNARALLNDIARGNAWRTSEDDISNTISAKSILIGRTIKVAKVLLEADAGVKIHPFQLDVNFKTANFVPMDEEGIRLLKIMTQPDFKEKICKYIIPDDYSAKYMDLTMDVDGWDGTRYYYLFFDSDLKRLKKVKDGLIGQSCTVACYPWQEEIIKAAIPGADVVVFETDTIETILKIPHGPSVNDENTE